MVRRQVVAACALASALAAGSGEAQQRKPNILVIFGDDIGIPQISAYTMLERFGRPRE